MAVDLKPVYQFDRTANLVSFYDCEQTTHYSDALFTTPVTAAGSTVKAIRDSLSVPGSPLDFYTTGTTTFATLDSVALPNVTDRNVYGLKFPGNANARLQTEYPNIQVTVSADTAAAQTAVIVTTNVTNGNVTAGTIPNGTYTTNRGSTVTVSGGNTITAGTATLITSALAGTLVAGEFFTIPNNSTNNTAPGPHNGGTNVQNVTRLDLLAIAGPIVIITCLRIDVQPGTGSSGMGIFGKGGSGARPQIAASSSKVLAVHGSDHYTTLSAPASAGDTVVNMTDVTGMAAGDYLTIDVGYAGDSVAETIKIGSIASLVVTLDTAWNPNGLLFAHTTNGTVRSNWTMGYAGAAAAGSLMAPGRPFVHTQILYPTNVASNKQGFAQCRINTIPCDDSNGSVNYSVIFDATNGVLGGWWYGGRMDGNQNGAYTLFGQAVFSGEPNMEQILQAEERFCTQCQIFDTRAYLEEDGDSIWFGQNNNSLKSGDTSPTLSPQIQTGVMSGPDPNNCLTLLMQDIQSQYGIPFKIRKLALGGQSMNLILGGLSSGFSSWPNGGKNTGRSFTYWQASRKVVNGYYYATDGGYTNSLYQTPQELRARQIVEWQGKIMDRAKTGVDASISYSCLPRGLNIPANPESDRIAAMYGGPDRNGDATFGLLQTCRQTDLTGFYYNSNYNGFVFDSGTSNFVGIQASRVATRLTGAHASGLTSITVVDASQVLVGDVLGLDTGNVITGSWQAETIKVATVNTGTGVITLDSVYSPTGLRYNHTAASAGDGFVHNGVTIAKLSSNITAGNTSFSVDNVNAFAGGQYAAFETSSNVNPSETVKIDPAWTPAAGNPIPIVAGTNSPAAFANNHVVANTCNVTAGVGQCNAQYFERQLSIHPNRNGHVVMNTDLRPGFRAIFNPAAPSAIALLSAVIVASNTVELSWTPKMGCTKYNVYRKLGGGAYTLLTPQGINNTRYRDTTPDSQFYTYAVTPISRFGGESATKTAATPTPSVATLISAVPGVTQNILSWTAVSGATYKVQRSTTSGSGYATVASGLSALTYTDTGLTNGTQYYYVILATLSGVDSVASNELSATPVSSGPTVPVLIVATPVDSGAIISWSGVSGATYKVRRSLTSGSGYATIASGVNALTYTDSGLTNGTTYYYVIIATVASVDSAASNEVSSTPAAGGSGPTVPILTTITPLTGAATLSWTPVAGAKYKIRRSVTSGSGYTTVASGVVGLNYTDPGLINGTPYYYVIIATVAAVDSAASNELSVTPAAGGSVVVVNYTGVSSNVTIAGKRRRIGS